MSNENTIHIPEIRWLTSKGAIEPPTINRAKFEKKYILAFELKKQDGWSDFISRVAATERNDDKLLIHLENQFTCTIKYSAEIEQQLKLITIIEIKFID